MPAVQLDLFDGATRRNRTPRQLGPAAGKRDTSREAAVTVHCLSHQEIILAIFRGAGARGLTCDQVASCTGWENNQVSPRLLELRELGVIVETERRRETRAKRKAIVYTLANLERTPT